jgi:hypothetical protein
MTSSLALLLCAAYLTFVVSAAALTGHNASTVANKTFLWASLGDSWAVSISNRLCAPSFIANLAQSGVAYGLPGQTDYDGNQDDCRRNKHAYSVQISRDNSWVPDGRPQGFHFQSCIGTHFTQIDRVAHLGHIQLNDIPSGIDMIMLQAGHDNADLASVAAACVYVPGGTDFGPAYPDPMGKCAQEIVRASSYINGMNKDQLFQDVRWIVNSVFNNDKVKNNPNFQLFMPGYAQVFYDQSYAGDWCGNASFAIRGLNRPVLSLALRQRINQLLSDLNNGIRAGVADSFHSDRTHFIDVDKQFEGHRFCQPEHTLPEQYTRDKVYLWNMAPTDIANKSGVLEDDTTLSKRSFATAMKSDSGMVLRPFHPKEIGYRAMTNAIFQALNNHYGTISAMIDPVLAAPDVQFSNSIQVLFGEHGGYFSWYAYQGPFGKKVNPCARDNEFKLAIENVSDPRPHDSLALAKPPTIYPSAAWKLQIDGWSDEGRCRIEGAREESGALKCGDPPFLWYPLTVDASYGDGIIRCSSGVQGGVSFHRAWVVEW